MISLIFAVITICFKKKVITIDGYKSITVKHWVILGENVKLIRPKKKENVELIEKYLSSSNMLKIKN